MKFYVDSNSKTIYNILVLLFFLWGTELHSMLWYWHPEAMEQSYNLFLQPGYNRYDVSLEWWCKTFFDDFMLIAAFNVAANHITNKKLAVTYRWLSVYYAWDLLLFIWNYKSIFSAFYVLLGITSVILILLLVRRKYKKSAIVVELEKDV